MLDQDPKKFLIAMMQQNRGALVTEGVAFVVLGLCALAAPVLFSLVLEFFLGAIALIAAAVLAYRMFKSDDLPNKSSTFMTCLIYFALGLVLLLYPLSGIVTLNLLLACFFIFDGIFKLTSAMQLRPTPGWGWLFFNGFLSFVLAILILMQWPTGSAWILGVLLGINLLFSGLIQLGLVWSLPDE